MSDPTSDPTRDPMRDPMRDAMRSAAAHEPGLHAAQLAALARGGRFDVTRAVWLDRQLGHARISAAYDDPWGALASAIEVEAAAAPVDSLAAWTAGLADASARAWPIRARGLEVTGLFDRVALGLPRLVAEHRDGERAELRADVLAAIARMLELDVDIDLARPRYAWRLPWQGAALETFHGWLAPLFAEVPAAAPHVPDAVAALARADAAVDRFVRDLAPGPEPADYAAAAFAPVDLAPLRASAHAACAAAAERHARWYAPHRLDAARWLRAAVDRARTPTHLDLLHAHAASADAIEATWWRGAVGAAGLPLRAALIAEYDPGAATVESRAAAARVAAALLGGEPPAAPRWLWSVVDAAIAPNVADPGDDLGAYLGEAGSELLGPYRTWRAARVADGRLAATDDGRRAARELLGGPRSGDGGRAGHALRAYGQDRGEGDADAPGLARLRPPLPGTSGRPDAYHVVP